MHETTRDLLDQVGRVAVLSVDEQSIFLESKIKINRHVADIAFDSKCRPKQVHVVLAAALLAEVEVLVDEGLQKPNDQVIAVPEALDANMQVFGQGLRCHQGVNTPTKRVLDVVVGTSRAHNPIQIPRETITDVGLLSELAVEMAAVQLELREDRLEHRPVEGEVSQIRPCVPQSAQVRKKNLACRQHIPRRFAGFKWPWVPQNDGQCRVSLPVVALDEASLHEIL